VQRPYEYHFEWDPLKARGNAKKHGITFERAAGIFLDLNALSQFDEPHSDSQERWVTLGLDREGSLLVVCHTFQEQPGHEAMIRIFSARKATRKEDRIYEAGKSL
jgi:uncharacterized DUF497 family protein